MVLLINNVAASPSARALVGLAVAIAAFVAVYGPLAGHGFISDDFGWIQRSRLESLTNLRPLLPPGNDFFRPAVALSFAIDYAIFGNQPLGYGLTNVLLAVACALALVVLLRQLGLPIGAAVLGGTGWLFNFHGINMAVLWLSGRTALLLTLFAVTAAALVVRGRYLLALIPLALALLSKEEAVVLPFLLGLWMGLRSGESTRRRDVTIWLVSSIAVLAAYLAARHAAGSMAPATAPYYYRFTFDPLHVGRNILEYADRAATFPALITLLAWLVLRPSEDRGHADTLDRRRIACGLSWFAAGFAITIFLPVRSSLYACLPSVGAAIVAGEVCRLRWMRSSERWRAGALVAAAVVLIAAAAIHVGRADRWVALADFSTRTLDGLARLTSALPPGSQIVVHDGSTDRANLRNAFGSMLEDAYRLKTGRSLRIWMDPPLPDLVAAGVAAPCAPCVDLRLSVQNDGHVRTLPAP
jgi:hypothetical protein